MTIIKVQREALIALSEHLKDRIARDVSETAAEGDYSTGVYTGPCIDNATMLDGLLLSIVDSHLDAEAWCEIVQPEGETK